METFKPRFLKTITTNWVIHTSNPHVHLSRVVCYQVKHSGGCDHSKRIWSVEGRREDGGRKEDGGMRKRKRRAVDSGQGFEKESRME